MRIGIIVVIVTGHISWATRVFCQGQQPSSPLSSALKFFDPLASTNVDATLQALRTVPISSEARELVRATLPPDGTLRPTRDELKKLDALTPVLIYHERDQAFDIKVIDLPQAVVALHARAILLITRPALDLLTSSELQALAAHEVGHDFLWEEFEQAKRHGPGRQQLELECDGIAVLTLVALGLDPKHLLAATVKLERFNEQFGTPSNAEDYPKRYDRERFLRILLRSRQ